MAHPTHRYILKSSQKLSPKVLYLSFEREDNTLPDFIAGQFITLHIEGPQKILHRSYSVANSPNHGNTIDIACAFVEGGVASNLLFGLKPGESVLASGPYGLFVLKDESPSRYVLVATGTGVTPYRSMLGELEKRFTNTHPNLKVDLIFGVRNQQELLFKDQFLEFAKQHPHFQFHACYTQEANKELLAFEHACRIQPILENLALDPTQDVVYLCGNPNMIDETFLMLTNKGFDRKSVRREKYLFSH